MIPHRLRRKCVKGAGPLTGMLMICLLVGGMAQVMAASVSGLYQAEAEVAGREPAQRSEALSAALAKVLVKVTGNRGIAAREELKQDLAAASRYVQQYSYRSVPEAGQEKASSLLVSFDPRAVERLLRDRGLPVWGGNRPTVLLWLGRESGGKRRLLTPEQDADIWSAVETAAAERGLPLIFPLLDLEDRAQLQVSYLWGDFEADIAKASARYNPDLILTGRMVKASRGLWRGSWRLYQGRNSIDWRNEAKLPGQLSADGLQHAADLLASRFAPLSGGASLTGLRLKVSGVESLSEYAAVDRLVASQNSLERARLVSVESDALIYQLQLRGGLQALEQGLKLGGVVEPDLAPAGGPPAIGQGADLHYRLRR